MINIITINSGPFIQGGANVPALLGANQFKEATVHVSTFILSCIMVNGECNM